MENFIHYPQYARATSKANARVRTYARVAKARASKIIYLREQDNESARARSRASARAG